MGARARATRKRVEKQANKIVSTSSVSDPYLLMLLSCSTAARAHKQNIETCEEGVRLCTRRGERDSIAVPCIVRISIILTLSKV